MSPLRSPRAAPTRPTLRERAATLAAGLARSKREPETPPAPSSPDCTDPAHAAVAAYRTAYAAWEPHLDAQQRERTGSPAYSAAEEVGREATEREGEAIAALVDTRATTSAGLRALAGYLPEAITLSGYGAADDFTERALRSLCDGVLALVSGEAKSEGPDPIHGAIAASRRAEAEMETFERETACPVTPVVRTLEDALASAQTAARNVVWATAPTTRAGRLALVEYGRFQAELHYGQDWRDHARNDVFGEIATALSSAIEATAPDDQAAGPMEAAPAPDLSSASINHLARLYDHLLGIEHAVSTACNAPWAWEDGRERQNAVGNLLDEQADRLFTLAGHVVAEIRARVPVSPRDRDDRLATIVKRDLDVNSEITDPAIVAALAAAWGR